MTEYGENYVCAECVLTSNNGAGEHYRGEVIEFWSSPESTGYQMTPVTDDDDYAHYAGGECFFCGFSAGPLLLVDVNKF